MVSSRQPDGQTAVVECNGFVIEFIPVHLPEDQDNERIKRLSKQILACIRNAREERRRAKRERKNEQFEVDLDDIFGLKGDSV